MLTRLLVLVMLLRLVAGSPATHELNTIEQIRNAKSEEIRKYMNESVDPCENFYDFACGNWKTHHPATSTLTSFQTRAFIMAVGEFDRKLGRLLTTANEADTATERKVKDFYESCMNLASLTSAGRREKLKRIANEFGEMPALTGKRWKPDTFDWLKTVAEIWHKYDIRIIFGYTIVPDWQDRTAYALVLTPQKFVMKNDTEYYVKRYASYLSQYLSLKTKEANKIAKEIVDFETILWSGSVQYDANKLNYTTVEHLHNKHFPELDIKKLTNISFGYIPSGVVVDRTPSYERIVIDAVKKTPKKVVANYIFYHLLSQFFINVPKSTNELERFCVDNVEKHFGRIVTNMFYRANNLTESKRDVEQMWQAIKSTAENVFGTSSLSWFDDTFREFALNKLHSMKMEIPSYEHNNFDHEYGQLTLDKDDYMENCKSLLTFDAIQNRASLDDAPHYLDLCLALNSPSYCPSANTIILPASTLTSDYFWSPSDPNALIFSRLGFLLSHELIHGFSGIVLLFNILGNFQNPTNDDITSKYEERMTCLHDQYHNYTYGDKPLPQQEFQTENASDTGGLLMAYRAYRRWYESGERTKGELELETLPNMNYTNNQLFFIHYAQTWCADTLEIVRSLLASFDVHSPDEIRGFVPLTNLREFSKEFNCPKGSPMNPVKKCEFLRY